MSDEAEVLWLMAWGGARDRTTARAWLADDPDIVDKIGRFMVPAGPIVGRGGETSNAYAARIPFWVCAGFVASGALIALALNTLLHG